MEITLKECLDQKLKGITSLLELKLYLMESMKTGFIFIDKPVDVLEIDEPFNIYFCEIPNPKTKCNAFPIPKEEYTPKKGKEKNAMLQRYYNVYYNQNVKDYSFDNYSVHIAQNYVWYYLNGA